MGIGQVVPPAGAPSAWQATAASVRGKSHADGGIPNQDSVVLEWVARADAWIAVVSDGAGTAARAEDGSREATRTIAAGLRNHAMSGARIGDDLPAFRAAIEASIGALRTSLLATGQPLSDFHCTFVACLVAGSSGCIASVGDSVALATRFVKLKTADGLQQVDFFPDDQCVVHEPERGEYANETHFITQPDWRDHLRVASLPARTDGIILMTDGAMDVAMSRKKVFRGFLSNLVGRLAVTTSRDERDATVSAWLGDRQTFAITGDDKTLVALLREDARILAKLPLYLGDEAPAEVPVELPATRGVDAPPPAAARLLGKPGVPASVPPVSTPARRMPLSSAFAIGAAALVMVAALGAAYWFWKRQPGPEMSRPRIDARTPATETSTASGVPDRASAASAAASVASPVSAPPISASVPTTGASTASTSQGTSAAPASAASASPESASAAATSPAHGASGGAGARSAASSSKKPLARKEVPK